MKNFLVNTVIFTLVLLGIGAASAKNPTARSATPPQSDMDDDGTMPSYHAHPPTGPLPATLNPKLFHDALTQNIYAIAAKEKAVLYQQPCYCHCDRSIGHKSLLDCYVDRHASLCATCKQEAAYAYEQTKKGKSPAQIRDGIINGDWKKVDMTTYDSAPASK
jgi:hypothetical protein